MDGGLDDHEKDCTWVEWAVARNREAADQISAFGTWSTNGHLIATVACLGYLPEPVLDLTYNAGKFWTIYHPSTLVTNDLDPQWDTDHHEDFRATPWADGSFESVVFDPPYKLSGTNVLGEFDRQYGTAKTRSKAAILSLIAGGIAEGSRLTNGFLLVKCQDQVNGGQVRWQTNLADDVARALELRKVDEFFFPGGGPPQDASRGQQHARHDRSALIVYERKKARRAEAQGSLL